LKKIPSPSTGEGGVGVINEIISRIPIQMISFRISLILIAIFALTLAGQNIAACRGKNPMAAETIEGVLKKQTKDLMSIPGVVGTGQGLCEGKPCIKVFIIQKTPDLDHKIPKTLEGYPVVIEETGEIKALPKK
jgi:hypothetical protein